MIKEVLLKIMSNREWSISELAIKTGYTYSGVNTALRSLHGQAYISGWRPHRGTTAISIWRLGDRPHAPRPGFKYKKHQPKVAPVAQVKSSYIKGVRIPWVFPDLGGI